VRPRRLELKGFTAFRDELEIDFDGLDLFALWGPMGSGKSSILDALTYALYGKVERIGTSMTQLVSQGQPRMSVILEFDVADQRYRIARSTPLKGSTKVLFERHDGSDWHTFGEGADRAREVNKTITDLIGLDYPAFTRAVLLPQGKFAEFLVGDAADRRKILTELLGLELFGRMAGIARSTADAAKSDAGARVSLLDQYGDVDEEVLKAAKDDAITAAAVAKDAVAIDEKVGTLGKRSDEIERELSNLDECAGEAAELAGTLEEQRSRLVELADKVGSATATLEAAKTTLEDTGKVHEKATADLEEAIARWGPLDKLAELRAHITRLGEVKADAAAAEASERDAIAAGDAATKDEAAARTAGEIAAAAATEAAHAEAEHETRLQHAERQDLVGTLVHELSSGDPCPVCERPLERIPESDATALKEAKRALSDARAKNKDARDALSQAESAVAVASSAIKTAADQVARCKAEREKRAGIVADLQKVIDDAFGGKSPTDPASEIAERIDALRRLTDVEASAAATLKEAKASLEAQERANASLEAEIATLKSILQTIAFDACVRRARKVLPDLDVGSFPATLPDKPTELAEIAQRGATALKGMATELEAGKAMLVKERASLVDTALEHIAPVLSEEVQLPRAELPELLASFRALARDLEKAAVSAAERVKATESDLAKKAALEKEVAEKRNVDATYRSLAKELSGNHIVDYLQSEALAALAAAGSDRLSYLSAGRYRLAYEDDEFFVIDAWNGEERRSVRTLSGGETFLASLALALALSDEVKNLAVTDKAPIESLFLDEGFGSLDAETLDTVVSAIEQLGGDGRMVGVITHVADVADRLPVKLVVTKSPRGSHIDREVQAGLELVG
jgi:exonuclease SbcC